MPNRIVKDIEGVKVLITHCSQPHPNDLQQDENPQDIIKEQDVKAVFYGHTHIPRIENKGGVAWINPGHLQESDKKGNPASFAIVEIKGSHIDSKIIRYGDIAYEV